jgi:hypothetical protein
MYPTIVPAMKEKVSPPALPYGSKVKTSFIARQPV